MKLAIHQLIYNTILSFRFSFYFNYMYVCMFVCRYVNINAGARGGQNRVTNPLELDL